MKENFSGCQLIIPFEIYAFVIQKSLEDTSVQPRCFLLVNHFSYETTLYYLKDKNYLIQRILDLLEKISYFKREKKGLFVEHDVNYLTRLYKCLRMLSGIARYVIRPSDSEEKLHTCKDSESILRGFTDNPPAQEWNDLNLLRNFLRAKYCLDPYFNPPENGYFKRLLRFGYNNYKSLPTDIAQSSCALLFHAAYQRLILLTKLESRINHSTYSLIEGRTREYNYFLTNRLWRGPLLPKEQEALNDLLPIVKQGLYLFDEELISHHHFNQQQLIALAGPYIYQILVLLNKTPHSKQPWFKHLLYQTPQTLFYISNYPYTSAQEIFYTLNILPYAQKRHGSFFYSHPEPPNSKITDRFTLYSHKRKDQQKNFSSEFKDSENFPLKEPRIY